MRGGLGSAIILLHGFPEDRYAFHQVMPHLAQQFTVVAVDLRGLSSSAASAGGYDAANMAETIHQLTEQLRLEHVYVVGHDVGGMVAYAFARLYPETSRGVMHSIASIDKTQLAESGTWFLSCQNYRFYSHPCSQHTAT